MRQENQIMKKKFGLYVVMILFAVGLSGGVKAQTSTVGSISGTVRDPQGAAVPKVDVLITEETTGQTRTVRSGEDGTYSAQSIPVGRYSVSVAPAGAEVPSPVNTASMIALVVSNSVRVLFVATSPVSVFQKSYAVSKLPANIAAG